MDTKNTGQVIKLVIKLMATDLIHRINKYLIEFMLEVRGTYLLTHSALGKNTTRENRIPVIGAIYDRR